MNETRLNFRGEGPAPPHRCSLRRKSSFSLRLRQITTFEGNGEIKWGCVGGARSNASS
ncbi:hypothetical protein IC582_006477 [Cucumis melo]